MIYGWNHLLHVSLRWRHNDGDSVSNHQPHDCLLKHLFRRRSKKPSKLPVTGLCAGNSPGTGGFPAQMASYAENVSIWWRHHAYDIELLWMWHLFLFCFCCLITSIVHFVFTKLSIATSSVGILLTGQLDIHLFQNMMTSSNGTFPALLTLRAGNSPVTGEFLSQRPATRSFDIFFDIRLNKRLRKQPRFRWHSRAHYDVTLMISHPTTDSVSP